ncbi:MAG TPA: multicopper oxidase domain-containing protein [Rubrobacter sp.]|nr:multicopper oxidase domain-containing protein [Rubrobacter sp.]
MSPNQPVTRRSHGLTRRQAIKLGLAGGLLGGAALLLPLERAAQTELTVKDRIPESRLPRPFTAPLKVPPVARPLRRTATTDFYEMTMLMRSVRILPEPFPKTPIFGYEGITPGPTIKATRGRRIVVRHINRLPRRHPYLGYPCTTSVHLHGNASEPQYDGWAEDVTNPGEFKDYVYPNEQDARTLWYHDHAIHHTSQNAYMGCAAFYLTDEDSELPLPKGRYDVPLVIQDKIFAKDGRMIFDDNGESSLFGDVVLVNGVPWPAMKVERRKYLFRILNASTSRGYNLALSSGEPLTVVGYDGGLGPAPQPVGSMRVGMAERYGVVIDFAEYEVGQQVILRNLGLDNNQDFDSTRDIMRFDVASEARDLTNNAVPPVLNRSTGAHNPMILEASDAKRTRDFRFERKNGLWTVNGETWEDGRVQANPGRDEVEIWRLTNNSGGWFHPVHIHLIDFKILDRNGGPPHDYERGPKDVAYIGEGETVRVIARFGPKKGKYMMHCHNLVHEDHDMMVAFEAGVGGPDPMSAPAKPISEMRPL